MFSSEELADIHFIYGFTNGNATAAREEYARRFPERRCPDARTFSNTHRRFREGTLFRSSREAGHRTISAEVAERVLEVVRGDPKVSTRRVALRLNISHWTVWKILNDEGLYPYHTLQVQKLEEGDKPRRLEFCVYLQAQERMNERVLWYILWTDESTFTRDGVFNSRNEHTWAEENPHVTKETHNQKKFSVNVWAGILGNKLIGPHVFPGTLNSNMYLEFLRTDLPRLLDDVPLDLRYSMIFQQDGAPPHSTIIVRDYLTQSFREPWIGRNGPVAWPPRSPDLTPLDFFLWGYMKDLVYAEVIQTRDQLVDRIFEAAGKVREKLTTVNIVEEVKRRVEFCVEAEGGHFEQFLK